MEEWEICKIIVGKRIRPLDIAFVQELAHDIQQRGLIEPIIIRQGGNLIAGLHRLEAFKLLERDKIPAIIKDVTDSEAEDIEITENLIRKELCLLEKAEMLGLKKEKYEKDHPDAKQGGDRRSSTRQIGNMKSPRFTKLIEDSTGLNQRTSQRLLQINKIAPEVRQQLHGTWISRHQMILLAISGLPVQSQKEFADKFKPGQMETVVEKGTARSLINQLKKNLQAMRKGQAILDENRTKLGQYRDNKHKAPEPQTYSLNPNDLRNRNPVGLESDETEELHEYEDTDEEEEFDPDRIQPGKKGGDTSQPKRPERPSRPQMRVIKTPDPNKEATKKGNSPVKPNTPLHPTPSESKSAPAAEVIGEEKVAVDSTNDAAEVEAEEKNGKQTPDRELQSWIQGLIEVMRGKQDWDYLLLVNMSGRPNGSSWPTNIKAGGTIKVQVQAEDAGESVEFSCKSTNGQAACFISEEVIWGK